MMDRAQNTTNLHDGDVLTVLSRSPSARSWTEEWELGVRVEEVILEISQTIIKSNTAGKASQKTLGLLTGLPPRAPYAFHPPSALSTTLQSKLTTAATGPIQRVKIHNSEHGLLLHPPPPLQKTSTDKINKQYGNWPPPPPPPGNPPPMNYQQQQGKLPTPHPGPGGWQQGNGRGYNGNWNGPRGRGNYRGRGGGWWITIYQLKPCTITCMT